MNKKLVAAALGLAFAAPVFADSSNVTLYGRVHQTLDHQSTEAAGVDAGGNFVVEDASSRFGIKGQEDLGGGLSAIFAYEFGVDSDNVASGSAGAAGPLSTRHAYLGLKGAYGLFVIGSQDGGNDSQAPLYNQASLIGSVSNNGGPLTTVGSTNAGTGQAITREQRVGNSFGYAATFAGVQVNARHALSNGTDNAANNVGAANKENDTRSTEIAATYKVGALTVGGGLQSIDSQERTQNTLNATSGVEQVIQGVATYNFGTFSVGGLVAQKNLYAANANGEDSNTEYALSATLPLSANSGVFGMYADAERNDLVAASDITQVQIAYYYDLSKRTRTYVGYNRLNTEVKASGAETDQDNFTIGLRHNF
ncbi:MAG: porin [Gammaproteobacteria bacterium]|uniref:porin n=1 Tax=Limnobacter sp. TaxID=2003368 RepID=UPI001D8F46B5|nr:porin [Limnobacter sp.]MBU0784650.1 porin [Gammaproteobacteria bacterium]MBU0848035.1 porin [Gammaproteobacteria bacterium]MBU1266326.1 porin [Gammaproteobacteria bacterium]MBU1529935.1 porin [Gammaproteobacteria bacterium]MBU1779928.1 porin [Gammaproteobacteria bacterium]